MLRRIVKVVIYLSLVAVAVELGLRTLVIHGLGRQPIIRYDSMLGWTNVASLQTQRSRNDGRHWRIRLDAAGRREVHHEVDPAAPHLVVLGDSFVFGDSVDQDDHFLTLLRARLGVNVHNLGVVGYATDQELLALRQYRERCDTLILMTYTANDLNDNLSSFEAGGIRFKPKMASVGGFMQVQPVTYPFLAWARHQSYVTMLGLTALYRLWPTLPMFDPAQMTGRREAEIQAYLALVREIAAEAVRRGVKKLIIVVWSYRSSGDSEGIVAKAAATSGAQVVNLDREFARRVGAPDALYFPVSMDPGHHWNERGHAVLATILANALEAESGRSRSKPESTALK